jgi:hypothetical protein
MVLRPFSADLQKTYRDTLLTPGSPETIDDGVPVMPVAVVAGSLNSVNANQTERTLVVVSGNRTTTGTTTVYTVPASSRIKVIGFTLSYASQPTASAANCELRLNSIAVGAVATYGTATNGQVATVSQNYVYANAPTLAATQLIQLVTSVDGPAWACVTYVLESV